MTLLEPILRWWDAYWFATSTEYNYGFVRFFLLGAGFYFLQTRHHYKRFFEQPGKRAIDIYAEVPLELLQPSLATRLLPPSPAFIQAHIYTIWKVLNVLAVMAMLGICTRLSVMAFAYLFIVFFGLHDSFGWFNHKSSIYALFLPVIAFAPGIDSFSVDRILVSAWSAAHGVPFRWADIAASGPVSIWPMRLVMCMVAINYCSSGMMKLFNTGWPWVTGDVLGYYITRGHTNTVVEARGLNSGYFSVRAGTRPEEKWRDGIGLETYVHPHSCPKSLQFIGKYRIMMFGAAASALALEIGAPVVLISPVVAIGYVTVLTVFHLTIGASLGPVFIELYGPAFLACVPVNTILATWVFTRP